MNAPIVTSENTTKTYQRNEEQIKKINFEKAIVHCNKFDFLM